MCCLSVYMVLSHDVHMTMHMGKMDDNYQCVIMLYRGF